ncbi:MAG: YceI family protein [Sulfurimonadaceae bacterium]|nr:YceI family protein [Sulfurimonadaceae bacterium]
MRTLVVLITLLSSWLYAAQLDVVEGRIITHTKVFGDSSIEPSTSVMTSYLSMGNTIESMNGHFTVSMRDMGSDKKKRDKDMHKKLESQTYPSAIYMFDSVNKYDQGYEIKGNLKLHGITKPLTLYTQIVEKEGQILMHGTASLLMSDFGIEPPVMLLLFPVRDRVDIRFNVTLVKE